MDFYYKGECIRLLPDKAAHLPQYRVLLIADIHLGKASHFRKEGIIIPVPNFSHDLHCIEGLIRVLEPTTIVFLGDLFHSQLNDEWFALKEFLVMHKHIHFVLTKGNHDILPDNIMGETAIEVVESLQLGKYLLCTHEPLKNIPEGKLNIAGHVHPGIRLKTQGRQSYRLPCFYQKDNSMLLPAFGHLTGLHLLKKESGARVFPVFPTEVIEWTQSGNIKVGKQK